MTLQTRPTTAINVKDDNVKYCHVRQIERVGRNDAKGNAREWKDSNKSIQKSELGRSPHG